MPLNSGEKLGPYQIVAPLGAGGMGEVYRARDTQLEREVAVKVLPRAMAADPERLARFDREAKVLAALNHPNIATIYGLVEFSGGRALVMELVPGLTLGDRLKRGAVGLEETLKIAGQVADALEAAHDKGIVHRDLKPGNIMITPDGLAKVLDFGLASTAGTTAPGDPENSPTLTMTMTQAGYIVGTAAYMSPEQAAGTPVDRRADIWSFGVVLWEMLTGQRLFKGDTVAHTLAAVLQAPISFEALKSVPAPVRELVARCLDRDVKSRLRDIGEARVATLRYMANPVAPAAEAPMRRSKMPWLVAAALALAVLGLGAIHFRETPPVEPSLATTLLPPEGGEFNFGTYGLPAISPDGMRIVYGARAMEGKTQLWLRRLDSPAAQPLAGTEDAGFPFWSPDSRWVGFGQERKLKKIDVQGGPPIPITDIEADFRGGTWNVEGVILFGLNRQGPLLRVSASGGKTTAATVDDGSNPQSFSHRSPWFLPDGRHFLYTNPQDGDIPVRVGSLDEPGKPGKLVAKSHSTVAYAQGYLLYLLENTLMAQPFDAASLSATGDPSPLAEGVPTYQTNARSAAFTVARSGLLVYQAGIAGRQSELVWRDRSGQRAGIIGQRTGLLLSLALSPDGKQAAANDQEFLWVYDTGRGVRTRLSSGNLKTPREPVWAPDDRTIFFAAAAPGSATTDIFRKSANGTGAETSVIATPGQNEYPEDVSADGKWLLYRKVDPKNREDMWVLPLDTTGGKQEPKPYLQTAAREGEARFSPDGRWAAYRSNESGQDEIYVGAFPTISAKYLISSGGGAHLRWSHDGREIFYVSQDGQLISVEVSARNGELQVGKTQKLFGGVITTRNSIYDVSADGKKFLVIDEEQARTLPLTLRQNWMAALRK
ncbi:MAG: hypothetical protein RL328_2425 [Acidobacteriota bacterium]|jgi:Tol biopolymer transport system component